MSRLKDLIKILMPSLVGPVKYIFPRRIPESSRPRGERLAERTENFKRICTNIFSHLSFSLTQEKQNEKCISDAK